MQLCFYVVSGHSDEHVSPVDGGWADNEKAGQKNEKGDNSNSESKLF